MVKSSLKTNTSKKLSYVTNNYLNEKKQLEHEQMKQNY